MVKKKVPVYCFKIQKMEAWIKTGYLRDVKGQFITPLLILKEHQYQESSNIS